MTLAPARPSTAPVEPESVIDVPRKAAVDAARLGWLQRLVDRSRRNILLYFRLLKTGMLDVTSAEPDALADLLKGETVTTSRLLRDRDDQVVAGKLLEIRRRAQANGEEKGIETLFLALGMATWTSTDGGRNPEAPILLVPIEIEPRGREGRSFALKRKGDVQVNLVLLQDLEASFGRKIAPETVANGNGAAGEPFEAELSYRHLAEQANGIPGFGVHPRAIIGNFAFQKMAMVRDLSECAEALARHDLIAALAGDSAARQSLLSGRADIDPHDLDRTRPEQEFLVLDADSSQQRVVASVLADQDGVIHGPPGTGKSQTIVNLISELAAHGRRTLFVAEKRAALEVVSRRLTDAGLGHLLLDLHGADVSRREIMKRISDSLELVHDTMPVDTAQLHARFVQRRATLNEHANRLHAKRQPFNLSVFEVESELLGLSRSSRSTTRWRGSTLTRLDQDAVREIETLLTELGGFEDLVLSTSNSPWSHADIDDGASAQDATDLIIALHNTTWPALQQAVANVLDITRLREPGTLQDVADIVRLLTSVSDTLSAYLPQLYTVDDLDALAQDLAPGVRGSISAAWAWCTNGRYRKARSRARALRKPEAASGSLAREIQSAAVHRKDWHALAASDSAPRACDGLDELETVLGNLRLQLEQLARVLGQPAIPLRPIAELGAMLERLAEDTSTLFRLPRKAELERILSKWQMDPLLDELRSRRAAADQWPDIFRHAWLTSILESIRVQEPALAGFDGRAHQRFADEFRDLDRERVHLAVARVRRAHAERVIHALNTYREQADLVHHEAAKRTRHMPLRKLLAQAPDVLTALFPCWMASPLAVSQLIGTDRQYFDIVLFDEASQVLPEDAAAALLRARKAVVAGDRNQLPPTTFFAGGDDEAGDASEDVAPTAGFESLLDIMSGLVEPWSLDWHYRSKDERLIAFANAYVYRNRLVTFPSAYEEPAISHVNVGSAAVLDGQEFSPSDEVLRVVELVLEHATTRPDQSLGVIALGMKHADRIQRAFDNARLSRPDLDQFFDEHASERFFIKNLERVQGDERDAVILSIGVGKLPTGGVDYRGFGPLNGEGGMRRLNVAITRARRRMTIISAFTHIHMDPQKGGGTGMLREYLQYAASAGVSFGDGRPSDVPMNGFESDIADALAAVGIPVVPQWGASKYRIDLVARHPQRSGQFVLAIECDGASYHSAPTARDRDRLRQQHLEALGWRFHRIWSTDWFQNRGQELERVQAAYAAAVNAADAPKAAQKPGTTVAVAPVQSVPRVVRGARPPIPARLQIEMYSSAALHALADWIEADGRLRTQEGLVEELFQELGYGRRGSRIMHRLQQFVGQRSK